MSETALKLSKLARTTCLLFALLAAGGCQVFGGDNGEIVMATQLFAERHCPITLDGPYPATALYANIDDLGIEAWQNALRGTEADKPGRMLALVHIGEQPTPGHRISLQTTRTRGDDLIFDVTRNRPDPNRMYAQVITQPCILISVPAGSYDDVEINEVDAPGA